MADTGLLTRLPERMLASHDREPVWVGELRRRALQELERVGLPTARDEDWKYSPAGRSLERDLDLSVSEAGVNDFEVRDIEGTAARLVFVDGVFDAGRSTAPAADVGLRVENLADALRTTSNGVPAWLGRCADFTGRGLAALVTAAPADGALVVLERGREIGETIHLVFVTTAASADRFVPVRNLVVAERGARGRILEQHVGPGADTVTGLVTEVALEHGASLELTKLLTGNDRTVHLASIEALVAADARFHLATLSSGGANSRTETRVRLDGRGADCEVALAALAGGDAVQDQLTRIEHAAPDATSRQIHRAVADDRARSIFNGLVVVRPGAHGTFGEQSSRSLLLSEGADAHTRPQLDISEDEVRCSHGATVGALDREALYYLRSRGISAADAQRLLVRAFAMEVVSRIAEGPARDAATELLEEWTRR